MPTGTSQISHEEWIAEIDREERNFKTRLPQLLKDYDGEYVAIYRGEVVGHHADDSTLFGAVHGKLGYVPFLIQRVSEEPEIIEIESIEIPE